MSYTSYDEYSFSTEPDPELSEFVEEYIHIFNMGDPLRDIMGAWTLEKPASAIEITLPEDAQREAFGPENVMNSGTPREIGAFLFGIGRWFHFWFDGYNLYISRFPDIPGIIAGSPSSALHGLLYGYPTKDVAQFLVESEKSGQFRTEKGWE